ncbi:MAG: cysteine--tRNA ligase [Patescibacteria group bacterium]
MAITLYNTLTKKKELFEPIKPGSVLMYHCGPTVYWTQHIGNMRAMVVADLIVRTFKYLDYDVKLVRNYTDVGHLTSDADEGDDKIEKRAKEEKISPKEIADKYIKTFEKDIHLLNVPDADYKPRATETIPEIIEMVQVLLEKDFAYSTGLAIYFDVSKAKDYTRLSGQKLENLMAGAGKADISDPQKKNPIDFALWFFKAGKHENALQYWKSPFSSSLVENGEGFPGWAIECSAMAKKFLGNTIDIHMGGIEHIPIHHTNEIAQSESANDAEFAHYWLHNEHITVNDRKMAKSEGTGYSLSEITEKGFNPLALRYFFLQAHYRSKQNFTWEAMQSAQNGLNHLRTQIAELGHTTGTPCQDCLDLFAEKISDDFNIPQGLAVVQQLLKKDITNEDKLATILEFDKVLGLKLGEVKKEEIPEEVQKLANEREKARKEKDWQKADRLRKEIENKGWDLKDTPTGPQLSKL